MRSFLIAITLFSLGLFCAENLRAQDDSLEVGAYADYLRVTNLGNLWGLGGDVAVSFNPYFQLEAQMAYDFEQSFAQGYTNPVNGAVTFVPTPYKILDGMIGPVLQTNGHRAAILYATVKGGFIDFQTTTAPASVAAFTGAFSNIGNSWNAVLYPAAGVKAFFGPIGLRLEAGDLIYFESGAHNNLRVTFGPEFRF